MSGGRSQSSNRLNRGGNWNNPAANRRTANRNRNQPTNRTTNNGFRLALNSAGKEAHALRLPGRTDARQPAKGMWIPVNHYLRPHAVFEGLPAGGFMGEVYQNVVPQFTLRDLPDAPLAGCVSWDHNKDYTGPKEVWHGSDLTVFRTAAGV